MTDSVFNKCDIGFEQLRLVFQIIPILPISIIEILTTYECYFEDILESQIHME